MQELEESPTKQIRLMGEDLALYKDRSGTYGCVDLHVMRVGRDAVAATGVDRLRA